jgi:FKBP-type peptidyl-prolyl cis-trans isomerase
MTAKKIVHKLVIVALAVGGVFLLPVLAGAEETQPSMTQKDLQSYAVGVEILRNFKRQGADVNLEMVIKGMQDAASGSRLLLREDELLANLNMFSTRLRLKKAEARLIAQQNNKEKGQAFLAENKTKEGVVTLPSGLQYKVLKAGDGKKPTEADAVVCRLRGTHIDGTDLDNSEGSGQPATLKVSEVIPAWREALKLMSVGSKWQLFIPPMLAYGQQGSGRIGPYETIVYELELVDIK